MTVNNNSNLINHICAVSGLLGKDLDALKLRLAQMSEMELQVELSKALSGSNFYEDMGLKVERSSAQKVSKEQEEQLKSALKARLDAVSISVQKAEDSNGGIASLWSGIKNLTGWGDSSNKVREQQKADLKALQSDNISEVFNQITGLNYTVENVDKFLNNEVLTKSEQALNGYTEGQTMALDVGADIISGVLAVGALALAPVTGGASLLVAAGVGATTKVTIKALAPGEYSMKDLTYDMVTGSINGALAPISNGLGGAAGTGIAKLFGLEAVESTAKSALSQAVKRAGKEVVEEASEDVVEQGGKNLLTKILAKQGSEYVLKEGAEKTLKTTVGKGAAYTADMMVDGAVSGVGDGLARAIAEGRFEDIPEDMLNGLIGGLIASPVIGGGFRLAGNVSGTALNKINNKITTKALFGNDNAKIFTQRGMPNCALLSTLEGLLNNSKFKRFLLEGITIDKNGNYNVKINGQLVTVTSEEINQAVIFSDKIGVRVVELAYYKLIGHSGFADEVASKFGLNPIHIKSKNITDELLYKLAKNSDDLILSLGLNIDDLGRITARDAIQHYFPIKNIDVEKRIVTLIDIRNRERTLSIDFEDLKSLGISIDGGSIKKTDIPVDIRGEDDVPFMFAGPTITDMEKDMCVHSIEKDWGAGLLEILAEKGGADEVYGRLANANDAKRYAFVIEENGLFTPYKLSLDEISRIRIALTANECIDCAEINRILDLNNKKCFELLGSVENYYTELEMMAKSLKTISNNDIVVPLNKLDFDINGRKIEIKTKENIPRGTDFKINYNTLIQSNMLTKECYNLCKKLNIDISNISKKNKTIYGTSFQTELFDIFEKIEKYSDWQLLTTYEIHHLTDVFEDLYKNDKTFAKELHNLTKDKANKIYAYVAGIKGDVDKILNGSNLEIDEHCIMRMFDRDVYNPIVNDGLPRVASFKEMMTEIKNQAESEIKAGEKSGKTSLNFIVGKFGGNGLEILLKKEGDGKYHIKTIIPK